MENERAAFGYGVSFGVIFASIVFLVAYLMVNNTSERNHEPKQDLVLACPGELGSVKPESYHIEDGVLYVVVDGVKVYPSGLCMLFVSEKK